MPEDPAPYGRRRDPQHPPRRPNWPLRILAILTLLTLAGVAALFLNILETATR